MCINGKEFFLCLYIFQIIIFYSGPSGSFINDYQEKAHQKIIKQVQRQKALEGIPDEELVLEEHPNLKVTFYLLSLCIKILHSLFSNWVVGVKCQQCGQVVKVSGS